MGEAVEVEAMEVVDIIRMKPKMPIIKNGRCITKNIISTIIKGHRLLEEEEALEEVEAGRKEEAKKEPKNKMGTHTMKGGKHMSKNLEYFIYFKIIYFTASLIFLFCQS